MLIQEGSLGKRTACAVPSTSRACKNVFLEERWHRCRTGYACHEQGGRTGEPADAPASQRTVRRVYLNGGEKVPPPGYFAREKGSPLSCVDENRVAPAPMPPPGYMLPPPKIPRGHSPLDPRATVRSPRIRGILQNMAPRRRIKYYAGISLKKPVISFRPYERARRPLV